MNTQFHTVYICIGCYIHLCGYPPNVEEIAALCSLPATTVRRCLNRLEAHRRITRIPGKERSLRLLLPTTAPALIVFRDATPGV